jgi:hypothetical protein
MLWQRINTFLERIFQETLEEDSLQPKDGGMFAKSK